jgi:low temperature requirement protein LtrA
MAAEPTWEGLAKALLILGVLWWSWTGYAWLTSVVDPEEGAVRLVMFIAMAAFLVAALCVPEAFDSRALLFAGAYGVVRTAHIALFVLASRDDPALRSSVLGLAGGTAVGVGLLAAASAFDGATQGALWSLALLLDVAEPYLFGAEGWKLVPSHFAERHGLILIIALVAERGLAQAAVGREQNEIARDSYSYLHFPMVAGVVLGALGLKKTLGAVEDPLKTVPAVAMLGGTALYLLAHVAFRLRNVRTLNRQRLLCALLLVAFVPAAVELPSLATLAILAGGLIALIAYETWRFGEARARIRHQIESEAPAG